MPGASGSTSVPRPRPLRSTPPRSSGCSRTSSRTPSATRRPPRMCCSGPSAGPPSFASMSSTPVRACPTSNERRSSSRSAAGPPGTAPGSGSPSRAGSPRRTAAGFGRRTIRAEGTSSSRSRLPNAARSCRHDGRGRPMSARVLVVDDEPQILRALRTSLHGAGYEVETAETAEGALSALAANPPDAVVLDLVLPDGSGTDVTRELRTWSSAPVIVLSVVGDEAEKVAALDAGADDYVTKPFGMDELLARLRAAMRRVTPSGEPVLDVGEIRVDLEKRAVTVAGRPVQLTPHEFDLLRLLAQNEGKLLTHR